MNIETLTPEELEQIKNQRSVRHKLAIKVTFGFS